MTYPGAGRLFHTGMVVDRLEPAMADLGAALGIRWAEPAEVSCDVWANGLIAPRTTRVTISVDGPHHLELIEHAASPPDDRLTGGRRVHHIGMWTPDFAAEVRRLETLGFASELSGCVEGDFPAMFSYHYNHHGGLWIEVVSQDIYDGLASYLAGGPLMPPEKIAEEEDGRCR